MAKRPEGQFAETRVFTFLGEPIEVTVDWWWLASNLGAAARENKSGKTQQINGAVYAEIKPK